ncbi:MAG: 2OG-Fe(II) oxygenase [Planctomycetes bacterium]|nr:2OG-Fe(II) oxygenase [Planctomycetota bacterium]
MSSSSNIKWLSKAIEQATKSANFCIAGCLPAVDPGIEIDGVGTISMPLKRGAEKRLIAACQVAPYGKGTQTLVDKRVRNTFELDPKKFGLSDAWNSAISDALRPIAEKLGLPADQLETKLYKLLVYEKGGFFLPHRDSEKHDRMVASLIVVLPNPFDGGKLVVRHGAVTQTLAFEEAAKGKFPCFAAFYTDCEHEVQRVYSGVRLCLAYNLVLKPKRGKAGSVPTAPTDPLAESIEAWVAKNPAKPLVFALNHHYTERGLSLDLLKGMDRQIASLVIAASGKTDCHVNLAQVSRHLLQSADDGSFDHGYSRYSYKPQRSEIEIGETYEDDLNGTEWTDTKGKKQPWGEISFDLSAIVSSEPIDDWKPTTEDYEGYTGNAGNTLDRWYHRSAIVIWQRDHHFEVVASSGVANSIPLFCPLGTPYLWALAS